MFFHIHSHITVNTSTALCNTGDIMAKPSEITISLLHLIIYKPHFKSVFKLFNGNTHLYDQSAVQQ